jgi:MSHA pilin protein MshD
MRASKSTQAGFSLIELVMAIVIISAAVAGVLAVTNQATAKSADPLLQTQAQAIARAYLEEIVAQPYADPDGISATENRATFDNVDDYHALDGNGCLSVSAACPVLGDCVCDQTGAPIDELPGYVVLVNVASTTLGVIAAKRVDVSVWHASNPALRVMFSSYRTDY